MKIGALNAVIAGALAACLLLVSATLAAAQGRISGTVQGVDGDMITLDDGTWFSLAPDARVVVSTPGTVEDFAMGQYVAITATRLDDGSLLASIVNVFPESRRGAFGGQFLQESGSLMTNATIDEATIDVVTATELMVSFGDQSERVIIPPTARITVQLDGALGDIQPGMTITANVTDGIASTVSLGG